MDEGVTMAGNDNITAQDKVNDLPSSAATDDALEGDLELTAKDGDNVTGGRKLD
jgi:hypothetical protein